MFIIFIITVFFIIIINRMVNIIRVTMDIIDIIITIRVTMDIIDIIIIIRVTMITFMRVSVDFITVFIIILISTAPNVLIMS